MTGIVTIKHIKAQLFKLNEGNCVDDTDYSNLRRLQKQFARDLVSSKAGPKITLKPAVIKYLSVKDFPDRQIIGVRRYRVSCHDRPAVYRIGEFRDLQRDDMPNYLKDFVGGI